MKNLRKILVLVLMLVFIGALVACGATNNSGSGGKTPGGNSGGGGTTPSTNTTITSPKQLKKLKDLTDYGASQTDYKAQAKTYDKSAKTYDGKEAQSQYDELAGRITEKHQDVENGESKSAYVKIFAMSDADEIMTRMAQAALTFDEMDRAVGYLSGSVDANVDSYIKKADDGTYSGSLVGGVSTWRDLRNNGKDLNEGWSLFDDWELYDRLKDYADYVKNDSDNIKNTAEDNAAWQYRSILKKVYEDVNLTSQGAARVAVQFLDYAIKIVEEKSSGTVDNAIVGSTFGDFAIYVRTKHDPNAPFDSLGDYDTLSYLLAFNSHYEKGADSGLKKCVTLYGYYYDYNKTYYFKALKNEETYAKQLKYEKQKTYTPEEWEEYVEIQQNVYLNTYRYSETFYKKFYDAHFNFQEKIENYDTTVYEMNDTISVVNNTGINSFNLALPQTTYTAEMKKAVQKSGNYDGIAGELALSDWICVYSHDKTAMKNYNDANTRYENGKKRSSEEKFEGKFYYDMERLKIVRYLLTNMKEDELASALYYETYAYSGSMVKTLTSDIKQLKYINEDMAEASEYVVTDVKSLDTSITTYDETEYGIGKISVLFNQANQEWINVKVESKASNAKSNSWSTMKDEIDVAINYDYENKVSTSGTGASGGIWEQRCNRMEDLVVTRVWSCCGESTIDSTHSYGEACKAGAQHEKYNQDGSVVTKNYDTQHKISLFVSDYEKILYRTASQMQIKLNYCPKEGLQYKSPAVLGSQSYNPGYGGNWSAFVDNTNFPRQKTEDYTIGLGNTFDKDVEKNAAYYSKENYAVQGYTTTEDSVNYTYTYEFVAFYLDEDCKYIFVETEEYDSCLNLYAGYRVTKVRGA